MKVVNSFYIILPAKLIPFFSVVSVIEFSVHKTIVIFFKSKSKYEISAHFLPSWRKLKPLLDVSSSPFLLFLSARLTESWLHLLDSGSRSRKLEIYMELTGG